MRTFLTISLLVLLIPGMTVAVDAGSQLIFQVSMDPSHMGFISIANNNRAVAVTVLTQYYNDEMEPLLWYLRVLPARANVMIDPFDHTVPGTETTVAAELAKRPLMSTEEKAGINSGRFVIVVTAVGANVAVDVDGDGSIAADGSEDNQARQANILFPDFLAEDLHGVDNIDNCGVLQREMPPSPPASDPADSQARLDFAAKAFVFHTKNGPDGVHDCREDDPATADADETDVTSKNVGPLTVDNAEPVAFWHLMGHFTEALVSASDGGGQTASWAGTPVIRLPVVNTANDELGRDTAGDVTRSIFPYQTLTGEDTTEETVDADSQGGRLTEIRARGFGAPIQNTVSGYTNQGRNMVDPDNPNPPNGGGKIDNTAVGAFRTQRGLNGGSLVVPALHGGGEQTRHAFLLLSAADDFGGPGKYRLIPAKTAYKVAIMDGMGDPLPDPAAEDAPVYGGVADPEEPAGLKIIVEGIRVMVDAGDCGGQLIPGYWTLSDLIRLVPAASSGAKDFDGLEAMLDPMTSTSPGSLILARDSLKCKMDFGDGDSASGSSIEDPDGVPTKDERTFVAGTLIVEEKATARSFVTTGILVLKFITLESTFAASWSLNASNY